MNQTFEGKYVRDEWSPQRYAETSVQRNKRAAATNAAQQQVGKTNPYAAKPLPKTSEADEKELLEQAHDTAREHAHRTLNIGAPALICVAIGNHPNGNRYSARWHVFIWKNCWLHRVAQHAEHDDIVNLANLMVNKGHVVNKKAGSLKSHLDKLQACDNDPFNKNVDVVIEFLEQS